MKRKFRGVRSEELALWQHVADQTQPLFPKKQQTADPQPGSPTPRFTLRENSACRGPRPLPTRYDQTPQTHDRPVTNRVNMDRKAYTRMVRGKLKPERRIDLHGMTLAQAHPALTGFVLSSYARQCRLVLVITGKGKNNDDTGPIPIRRGVLKHHVPQWLHTPPLSGIVLQVTQAHKKHGGEGAFYVYLRRQR